MSANGDRAVIKDVAGDFFKRSAVTTLALWSTTSATAPNPHVVDGLVNRLEFSSNGRWLVAALLKAPADIEPRTDAVLIIDTAATDKAVREVHYGANPVHFAFSRNGSRLAVAGSSGTMVLNLEDLAIVKTFSEIDSDAVALSPDGRYVATADRDTFVRVHDLQGEKPLRLFAYTVAAFGEASLQFTPDGKALVAGFVGSDAVWVWPLDHSALITSVCDRIGTPLTGAEWQTHLPGEPYTPVCTSLR